MSSLILKHESASKNYKWKCFRIECFTIKFSVKPIQNFRCRFSIKPQQRSQKCFIIRHEWTYRGVPISYDISAILNHCKAELWLKNNPKVCSIQSFAKKTSTSHPLLRAWWKLQESFRISATWTEGVWDITKIISNFRHDVFADVCSMDENLTQQSKPTIMKTCFLSACLEIWFILVRRNYGRQPSDIFVSNKNI